jgi:hypothetical protein
MAISFQRKSFIISPIFGQVRLTLPHPPILSICRQSNKLSDVMDSLTDLINALDREEIERARAMPPEEKLLAGPRLFDMACRVMEEGIRNERPDADDAEVLEIIRQRVALYRKLEQML